MRIYDTLKRACPTSLWGAFISLIHSQENVRCFLITLGVFLFAALAFLGAYITALTLMPLSWGLRFDSVDIQVIDGIQWVEINRRASWSLNTRLQVEVLDAAHPDQQLCTTSYWSTVRTRTIKRIPLESILRSCSTPINLINGKELVARVTYVVYLGYGIHRDVYRMSNRFYAIPLQSQ